LRVECILLIVKTLGQLWVGGVVGGG
jgi:hypothetical protein